MPTPLPFRLRIERKDSFMGSTSLCRNQQRMTGDAGASLVEYALLVSLIALVCFSALMYFQKATSDKLSMAATSIANAGR